MSHTYISSLIEARRYWEIWSRQDRLIKAIDLIVKDKKRRNIQPARATLREIKAEVDEKEWREFLPQLVSYAVVNEQKTINGYTYSVNHKQARVFGKERMNYL